jgi:SulP family sulfate permease
VVVGYAVALPLILLLATLAFFAITLGSGLDIAELGEFGWLLGPLESGAFDHFAVGIPALLDSDNWLTALGQWSSIGTILIISAVSILLTASALELLTGRDIDVNRELRVAGIDSSASYAFHRMRQTASQTDFTIVLAGMTPALETQLHLAEFQDSHGHVRSFATLDYGLEWCESQLLEPLQRDRARATPSMFDRLAALFPNEDNRAAFLSYFTTQTFRQGDILIEQGAAASDVYFLEEGEVSVHLRSPGGETIRIRRTGSGTVIGEIGFYLSTPRSASVIAEQAGQAYRLKAESLRQMEAERPEFAAALQRFMADLLAERLLHTTQTLEAVLK